MKDIPITATKAKIFSLKILQALCKLSPISHPTDTKIAPLL